MQAVMRWLAAITATVTLLGAVACASLNTTEIAQLTSGEKSGVVLAYKSSDSITGAEVMIKNVASGRVYSLVMADTENVVRPALKLVEAGRYRVISGDFRARVGLERKSLIEFWFKEFDVARGEIVDLGTLSVDPVVVRSDGSWSKIINNFPFSLSSEEESIFLGYSLDETHDASVQEMLAKYPSLAPLRVKRPLATEFDASDFRQIVEDAFKAREDGALRYTLDARRDLGERLKKFFRTNLTVIDMF